MGLGEWLAAQTEAQQYDSEVQRVRTKSAELAATHDEVLNILREYGAGETTAQALVRDMMADRELWLKVNEVFDVRNTKSC